MDVGTLSRLTRWMQMSTFACFAVAGLLVSSNATAAADEKSGDGFASIFDGKTLKNWDGNPKFWSVKDGAITGQTTKDNPTKGNTFIIWRGGMLGNFELKLQYKIINGNSGIQYRSFETKQKWVIGGYQADFEAGPTYSGILYGEKYRGILCKRGDKTVLKRNEKGKFSVNIVGKVGDTNEIQKKIKKEDWNDYHITAKGFHFIHRINGVVTADCTDEDAKQRRDSGVLALQLHAGPSMTVQFRNIRLKMTKKVTATQPAPQLFKSRRTVSFVSLKAEKPAAKKKIVFVAGRKSHGFGAHEHRAGCMLLAKALNENVPGINAVVTTEGWPKDASIFDGADSVVIYSDGGGGHPFNAHIEELDKLMKKGVGMVCIHYGVEVPKGKSGNAFLDWTGGYFETNWSVNPHWTAKYKKFPKHEITRGVGPFSIRDEWYYHMRFREKMQGVTPILTDLPPTTTLVKADGSLARPDNAHNNNKFVRAAVLQRKEEQHMAWATQRADGGRGFGFTGGHDHWNWGCDNFRKLVLNAIAWTAKAEIPKNGINSKPLTVKDLLANQDYAPPKSFNPARVQSMIDEANGRKSAKSETSAAPSKKKRPAAKPRFSSKVVTSKTPGRAVDIDVDIADAKQLFLVVRDGGNGFSCDWADWAEPRLVGKSEELKLTELKWKSARASFGQVNVGKNAGGKPLRIDGKSVEFGIGTHANSVIAYDLPVNHKFKRFKARGGLDNGGADQGTCGSISSVQFVVYTESPGATVLASAPNKAASAVDLGKRDAADALAGLDVAEGLEVTLFAAEPMVLSPSNIDVDHKGRVWVCEVVNYRHRNGSRKEGDRILILEDTDTDGKADKSTVFYQGRDIDTALGICVLGNRVIVSVAPNVFVFTDEDGDGKADKKELLFTKVGQPQHDHSTHAFMFGPDGKLYWNVGNTGRTVHDKNGKPIVDLAGNTVVDNGKPYYGGMPFRCNLDGSDFEVLAHNFRNNYEVTVDSFGTVWQSDNDDDGNRAVRINYVMEFGNFGYRDEMTGAGWKSPRTGMHNEIPLRHWHLRDPGVVPNLVQTGAGSPTGILVYEGNLLPKQFHGQVIHCDAGPNVVRAYPATKDKAGYKAEMVNVLHGARDKWFRPSDVCVAPDGSLIVADWYDPGVGGHRMGDINKGRIFRVAPPKAAYKIPKLNLSTIAGQIAALQNPNLEARYLAWTALNKAQQKAESALVELYTSSQNPRHRARALWLLGNIKGRGQHYVNVAIKDANSDIRITGLRMARRLKLDVIPIVEQLVSDESPQVRRECAIALRHHKSPRVTDLWVELALQHEGDDRWYLEALGIGADKQWDKFLNAWLEKVGDKWNTPAGRDIVWRSRAAKTPQLLGDAILSPQVKSPDRLRFFRAFDFQPAAGDVKTGKQSVLVSLAMAKLPDQAEITALALKHLGRVNVKTSPSLASAIESALEQAQGTKQYVDIVAQFGIAKHYPDVLQIAQANADGQLGVEAIRVVLSANQLPLIKKAIDSKDAKAAESTVLALGNSADGRVFGLLMPVVNDAKRSDELRRQAVRAVAKTRNGATQLVKLASSGKLHPTLKDAAGASLHSAQWPDVKKQAAKLFPLPATKNNKPLPPVEQLVKMKGDVAKGKVVFNKSGTCAKCHIVNKVGKEIGPNLSEIGGKLSRQAFLTSILFPNAGISHNYETYVVVLESGNTVTGILTSQTGESISLKSADAIIRTFKKSEIEEMNKQNISMMPADLQKVMTAEDLVNVVEYLTTLKKVTKK